MMFFCIILAGLIGARHTMQYYVVSMHAQQEIVACSYLVTRQENRGKCSQNCKAKLTRPFLSCERAGPRDYGTLTYYWECFQPVVSNNLQSLPQPYFETPLINALDHLELCHSDRCHYDTVVMSDGFRPVHPPNLENTVIHMDLTES